MEKRGLEQYQLAGLSEARWSGGLRGPVCTSMSENASPAGVELNGKMLPCGRSVLEVASDSYCFLENLLWA